MKNSPYIGTIFLVLGFVLFTLTATASMMIPLSEKGREHSKAPDNSPAIGDNFDLERIDFIHFAKPDKPPKPPKGRNNSCSKLLGVKWKNLPVDYSVNPNNTQGLSENYVLNTAQTSSNNWDDSVSQELLNDTLGIDYEVEYGVQNYENVVVFDSFADPNVIGVTTVWFTRRGKQIVEFDMLLNEHFPWGDAEADSSKMDLENILTHELGHALGLDDIYNSGCSEVTMYGYSEVGEIMKRTLELADVQGIQNLYGE